MNGKTIIISREETKPIRGHIGGVKNIEPTTNYIVWTFHSEEAAISAEQVFNESGFEYVNRL